MGPQSKSHKTRYLTILANMHVWHTRVYQKHHYKINITLERLNH